MISHSQHAGIAEYSCGSIAHLAYNNDSNRRSEDEVNLTNYLIHGWRDILNVFKNYSDINRIGLVPSLGGWIWFNFFMQEVII